MQKIIIQDKRNFVARDGYSEIHHVPTWNEMMRIVVTIDFEPAMDGREIVIDHYVAALDQDGTLRNVDGSDGDPSYSAEVGEYEVEVSPDYISECLAEFTRRA